MSLNNFLYFKLNLGRLYKFCGCTFVNMWLTFCNTVPYPYISAKTKYVDTNLSRTPGGILAAEIRAVGHDLNKVGEEKIKIVEEVGKTIFNILSRTNSLGDSTCSDKTCQVSTFQGAKGKCQVRSVCYTNMCVLCEQQGTSSKYYGETSKSLGERSREHIQDAKDKKQSSHIYVHLIRAHPEWISMNWEDYFRF